MTVNYPNDPIIEKVLKQIEARSEEGIKKYGALMTREDTTTLEWLKHAQEEALDLAVYLERIMQDIRDNNETVKVHEGWRPSV